MIQRQLGIFILNGLISVSFAYLIYWTLVEVGMLGINVANGLAYVSGMSYGFFANKKWTFHDRELIAGMKIFRYIYLHVFTLLVNVTVNSVVLGSIRGIYGDMLFAFLVAISVTAILNFLGLKYWVFNRNNNKATNTKKLSLP